MPLSIKNLTIFLTFFHLSLGVLWAQVSIEDSTIRMATLNIVYRGGVTGGEWQQRWSYVSKVGMDVGVKFRSNIYLQAGLSFLFTDRTNEEGGLGELLNGTSGFIVTDEGFLSEVSIAGRGFAIPLSLGYIIPLLGPNKNSGIYLEAGAEYLQHRFNYRVVDGEAAALEGEYAKGYDRMRQGVGFRQGLGYVFYDNRNNANFSIGLDFSQVPSRSGRQVFFPSGPIDMNEIQWDAFWGFRASWIYPLYNRAPQKAYFY